MASSRLSTYLAIGRIVGPHGVRGEMKVEVMTDFPERFEPGSRVILERDEQARVIASSRPHKDFLLVMLVGTNDRTQAELLRGQHLLISRQEAAVLEEDAYYEDELLGLNVVTETEIHLGTLSDILWTGANEVYVVQGDYGEVLLPAIAEVVLEVDLVAERMVVRLLPGLVQALDK